MIFIGIDVAKSKHDCCILGVEGEVLKDSFTFANNRGGFDELFTAIQSATLWKQDSEVRVGLEATGHYSTNLVAFIRDSGRAHHSQPIER